MCTHSSSASNSITTIGQKLYPFILEQFAELQKYTEANRPCSKANLLFEVVQNLKREFESLKNYEIKLVFPSVQLVFNTKDNTDFESHVNLKELQRLTQKKEALIRVLVEDLESEADAINLHKTHPVYAIIFVFNDSFFSEKAKWNKMLASWDKGCACFTKANNKGVTDEKLPSYLKH